MLIGTIQDIRSSEITPESTYRSRREFVGMAASATVVAAATSSFALPAGWVKQRGFGRDVETQDEITPKRFVTEYNNFYEFGTDKGDPAKHAHRLTVDPWHVEVAGLVSKPGKIAIEDLLKGVSLQERIYRLRCVEAWSAVVPWIGFPVKSLIDRFEPLGSAKFVQFTTLYRPEEMPGQRGFFSSIDYPYIEGLRLDEAYHPLTIFAVGMYGEILPNQNGAPFRLVVPWKYGFKSIKSIVKIELMEKMPNTTWNLANRREYGFYSNVNPGVDHPRWSQATERRLGKGWLSRIETRMFNGYDEVAPLYAGMNLRKHF